MALTRPIRRRSTHRPPICQAIRAIRTQASFLLQNFFKFVSSKHLSEQKTDFELFSQCSSSCHRLLPRSWLECAELSELFEHRQLPEERCKSAELSKLPGRRWRRLTERPATLLEERQQISKAAGLRQSAALFGQWKARAKCPIARRHKP